MEPLGKGLQGLVARQTVLPDIGQCDQCGFWDIDLPNVWDSLVAAGINPRDARCQCAQTAEQQARELLGDSDLPNRAPGETPRTLDNFQRRDGTENALSAAYEFIQSPDHILTLVGGSGTGKSHILEAIGRYYLDLDRTVHYDYTPDLLDELRDSYQDDSEGSVHAKLAWRHSFYILLLDDLGQGNASPWVQEKITDLVDNRLRHGGGLVVATNLTRDEIERHMGSRLASRLWDRGKLVVNTASEFATSNGSTK